MGKSYNNYMCKKDFHPSSRDNIKRVWMRQQKLEHEQKKQEEMIEQYRKEQDMHETRVLMGDSKAKVGLSFMYDAPPGMRQKEQEEGDESFKFEWQRNAPRESWMKGDTSTLQDQPFGVCVRNVRCIKCHQWGHINTDRECPLFNKTSSFDPSASVKTSAEGTDGPGSSLSLKPHVLQRMVDEKRSNQKMLEDEEEPEVAFLKNLTKKQKRKLLRRLNRLEDGDKGKKKSKKDSGKQKKKKHRKAADSSESSDEEAPTVKKSKKRKRKHSTSSDDSSSSSDDDEHRGKEKLKKLHDKPKVSHSRHNDRESHRHEHDKRNDYHKKKDNDHDRNYSRDQYNGHSRHRH